MSSLDQMWCHKCKNYQTLKVFVPSGSNLVVQMSKLSNFKSCCPLWIKFGVITISICKVLSKSSHTHECHSNQLSSILYSLPSSFPLPSHVMSSKLVEDCQDNYNLVYDLLLDLDVNCLVDLLELGLYNKE